MKLTRSRIIAAIAFLCLLAGSLEIYDPVVPKDAGTVLRAIEDKTQLPVLKTEQQNEQQLAQQLMSGRPYLDS